MKSQDVEFIGLKKYTHDQRTKIIKEVVVPILKRELGKNLVAIAADGSYARNEDIDFSDIELIIFVKNKNNLPRGFGKIINGVLVEGMFMTVGDFYRTIVTDLGREIRNKQMQQENAEVVMQNLENQWNEISGVDINEEATQLILYEQMFQAMAKYMVVVQSSIESIMSIM